LFDRYGLTLADWMRLYVIQRNRCAICGVSQEDLEYDLVLDHDHHSGEIRGLLCHKCNTGIGLLKDDPEILQNAIDYLDETPFEELKSQREYGEDTEDNISTLW
jgi:hypothetical protein